MSKCPLCDNGKYIILKTYKIKELSIKWRKSFGFDPFAGYKITDTLQKLICANCGLIYFNPPIYGDKAFYETLSKNAWYYETDKWEFDEAINIILQNKPKSLLEIGCGAGCFLEKIGNIAESAEGAEINDEALRTCRSKNLTVFPANISSLNSLGDESKKYDMVVLFEVLEHLENPSMVFANIDKMLNNNGLLIIAVPNPDGYLKELDTVLLDMPPHHNTVWSQKTFSYISDAYKWPILTYMTEPLRYVHYVSYLASTVDNHYLLEKSCINYFISKFVFLSIHLRAPFHYISDRQNLLGQTHMVVFQKKID
jgi:2-polyprenyl-3-methyl-5-hydroxy-6-metoxy-1,4-benzoquinol methylase